ncbi:hypothetical protein D6833_02105 [Candidatus Parcubacteria bacterium]|nr:MAG: hypothetical protein D6833_02105 [Candidatus Parcubacteria bacterium]
MSFVISTDRSSYYVLEPVRVALILRNESADPIRGHFLPNLEIGNLDIFYRRQGGEFVKYSCARQARPPDVILLPKTLQPQQEVKEEEILVFDTRRGQYILEEPGIYEFKAIYRDSPSDSPNARLESNILRVKVEPAPGNEREALKLYEDEGLARLIQHDPYSEEALDQAVQFLETYHYSVYAPSVRSGLVWGLGRKVHSQRATRAERELYETLWAEEVQERYPEELEKLEEHKNKPKP